VNRRAAIAMTAAEAAAFLQESRTMTCATIARDGRPHLMPLWYVLRGDELWAWTYAGSQKVRNLERDRRCTLQFDAVIHRETDRVAPLGAEIAARYGGADLTPALEDAMRAQAAKRVGLQFVERRRVSWDHRKLGGTY
jgi:hypothetical protein